MVNRDTDEEKVSDFFLSIVSELAIEYDCKLLGCGFDENDETWWIEIDGLPRNQDKMTSALSKVFKKWRYHD